MNRCLMIKTNDKRKLFTHEKFFPQLIEFSKTFKAEISIVNAENVKILSLDELAPALCNNSICQQTPEYELIEVKLPEIKKTRKNIIAVAAKIKKYIKEKFLAEENVSLKELNKKFKKYNLTENCLRNHLINVKDELTNNGLNIAKITTGTYKLLRQR